MQPAPRLAASRGRPLYALAFAAVATLLIAYFVVIATNPANAAVTLLSQGKTATASSTENGGTPASAAVDGNTGTRWSSAAADPQWLQVDLGASTTFKHVQLAWDPAFGKAYDIQTSDDGQNWNTVKSVTDGNGDIDDIDVNGTGRYVRINGTARGSGYGYSLYEFGVYS
jgi:hypothetical protein